MDLEKYIAENEPLRAKYSVTGEIISIVPMTYGKNRITIGDEVGHRAAY